jgi:hypothetical protein
MVSVHLLNAKRTVSVVQQENGVEKGSALRMRSDSALRADVGQPQANQAEARAHTRRIPLAEQAPH